MSWLDTAVPVRMKRVALVAADEALRDVLVRVADSAAVEIWAGGRRRRRSRRRGGGAGAPGEAGAPDAAGGAGAPGEAARRLQGSGHPVPDAGCPPRGPT